MLASPGTEAADIQAKTGAAEADPAQPYEYVTAAWARGEGSEYLGAMATIADAEALGGRIAM